MSIHPVTYRRIKRGSEIIQHNSLKFLKIIFAASFQKLEESLLSKYTAEGSYSAYYDNPRAATKLGSREEVIVGLIPINFHSIS